MIRPPSRPPAFPERLLAAMLGADAWTESILGDLHEEYARLATASRRLSKPRADLWYCLQALALGGRSTVARAARRLSPSKRTLPATPSTRGDSVMRTLALEARYAARTLWKRPGLSALVILTLALGLGANAAVFGMIDALLLRPFAIPDVDRVVMVAETSPQDGAGGPRESVSPANFLDWKRQTDVFERLAAFQWWDVNLAGVEDPERVSGFLVSADFFPALGVVPALGRAFTAEEETRGGHRRAVLGHRLWQRRFSADPAVVGKVVLLDAEQYEVVGVAPPGFDFPLGAEIWAPLSFDAAAAARRQSRYLSVIARLAPGRSLDDAGSQMAVVARRLEEQYPDANRDRGARVWTLVHGMRDVGLGPILSLWQASAAFVLLIACANIANLLLARGAERQRELAVRVAIGANRARLIRELFIESTLLALATVPAAVAVAWASIRLIRISMPPQIVRFISGWDTLDVDGRLVVFTAVLALGTALLFGILPAIQASRAPLSEMLKEGGRSTTAGRHRQRLRRALVVAEIALALPLLVAAGLGSIGANRFLHGPQGYDPDGLVSMRAVLPQARYSDPGARRRFTAEVVDALSRLPGVQTAAAINVLPSSDNNSWSAIEIDGQPNPDPANPPAVDYRAATPAFFDTMRIPILRGRGFTASDREDTEPVAVITQALAAKYFPATDALGRRIKLGDSRWLTVIGISGDVIHDWFGRRRYPTVYRPYAQSPAANVAFAIRTTGDPAALLLAAPRAVRTVDSGQPVFDVLTMRERLRVKTIGLQYVAVVMAAFGGLALLLAVVGVYSLMAFVVAQRTHEIGVRIALGATRRDVMRLAVGQTIRLTAVGALLGLLLATALGRLMEAGLLGVVSSDARLSIGVAAVLVLAALAAGYGPARRASAIDPILALRAE
jgi:putative ABC transport system permease protein